MNLLLVYDLLSYNFEVSSSIYSTCLVFSFCFFVLFSFIFILFFLRGEVWMDGLYWGMGWGCEMSVMLVGNGF